MKGKRIPQKSTASDGARGKRCSPLTSKNLKNWKKRGKKWGNGENAEKEKQIRKKRQKSGRLFHFAPHDRKGFFNSLLACVRFTFLKQVLVYTTFYNWAVFNILITPLP